MTLRGRLTAAFLVVVLGPVLLGALFVASTLAAVDRSRSTERLAVAASTVRTSVDALCQQLRATADAVALTADPAVAAAQLVGRGLAAAVLVTDVTGQVTYAIARRSADPVAGLRRLDRPVRPTARSGRWPPTSTCATAPARGWAR